MYTGDVAVVNLLVAGVVVAVRLLGRLFVPAENEWIEMGESEDTPSAGGGSHRMAFAAALSTSGASVLSRSHVMKLALNSCQ